ncbi:cupin domain-containing protein [Haloferacaceae archaeon DSL9]
MDRVSLDDVESVEAVADVHLSQLAAGEEMSVQHFRIDPGTEVPEHDHHHEQTGYITQGTLTFVVDGEEVEVNADDSYVIPAHEPHSAVNNGDEPVLGVDIFSPPRTNPDWQE